MLSAVKATRETKRAPPDMKSSTKSNALPQARTIHPFSSTTVPYTNGSKKQSLHTDNRPPSQAQAAKRARILSRGRTLRKPRVSHPSTSSPLARRHSHVDTALNTPRLPLHLRPQQTRLRPPRSPSRGLPNPRAPQRTLLLPYPHRRTSAQKHAWHTSDRTCGPI